MRDFKQLRVWQKAFELALEVYKVTRTFPRDEVYGLVSQIRRAASSITANLAEGCGRRSEAEFCRFIRISMGSATELESHLLLSKGLGYLKPGAHDDLHERLDRVKRMLALLLDAVESSLEKPKKARGAGAE
jgi:four helix bundle protein